MRVIYSFNHIYKINSTYNDLFLILLLNILHDKNIGLRYTFYLKLIYEIYNMNISRSTYTH